MAKLVDLKRTKAEKTAENKPGRMEGEDYPYGLRVSLDHHAIKKLGIGKLPKAGDKIHIHAKAHVRSVESRSGDGGDRQRIELELRHMAVEATKKASEQEEQEGNLTVAKAAMDKALDKQEAGGKGKGGYTATDAEGPED